MFKLICMTSAGLRWGQWMFETGRVKNLRHAIFASLARNVGWQEHKKGISWSANLNV